MIRKVKDVGGVKSLRLLVGVLVVLVILMGRTVVVTLMDSADSADGYTSKPLDVDSSSVSNLGNKTLECKPLPTGEQCQQ